MQIRSNVSLQVILLTDKQTNMLTDKYTIKQTNTAKNTTSFGRGDKRSVLRSTIYDTLVFTAFVLVIQMAYCYNMYK